MLVSQDKHPFGKFVSYGLNKIILNNLEAPQWQFLISFADPSSAQVGLNVEFVMKRAKLQYAIKSNHSITNYIILVRT